MRTAILFLFACGCNSTTAAMDAGDGAPTDSGLDLCDLDRFLDSGGAGNACPYASSRLCFHNMTDCPAQGCLCSATSMGPRWKCTTDYTCKDSGVDDASDDSASPSDAGADAD